MSKINSLNEEQIKILDIYRDKWLKIGLNTDRFDLKEAKPIIDNIYIHILKKKPVPIIIMDSPLSAWLAVCMFCNERNQVGDQVWNQVGDQVGAQVKNFVYPYFDGNFGASYFSFYDYMNKVLKIKFKPIWNYYKDTSKLSLIYPFDNFCVLSQKPAEINMVNNRLHKDGSPAIKYADGFSVWCLNGVRVSQEIVETSAEKLNAKLVLKEENAEVRREIVRKIGIEKVCRDLGAKVIDKKDDYELLLLNLDDERNRPYLKMKNPSIGVYHIEGVAPDIKTVQGALNWRNQTDDLPIVLS